MEGARGNEENVIRLHHAVLRVDGRPFDDRQQVALYAFAGDVRTTRACWRPAILSISSRKTMPLCSTRSIASRARFCWSTSFSASSAMRISRASPIAHLPTLRLAAEESRHHLLDVDAHLLDALRREDLEGRERTAPSTSTSISRSSSRPRPASGRACRGSPPSGLRVAGSATNRRAGGGGGSGRRMSRTRSRAFRSAVSRFSFRLLVAHQLHADLGEIANHRLHVPADVADLGELGGLDLDERASG